MYKFIRPLLFKIDAEKVHEYSLKTLSLTGKVDLLNKFVSSFYRTKTNPVEVFGLTFKNRIGLAAGFDKNGTAWRGLAALGFGHIEIGTVTPLPQSGNPKPRIFRLPEDGAIINRMGFPSMGAKFVKSQIQGKRPKDLIIGINLGKNKNTALEHAYKDYVNLIEIFSPLADYLTINISSPNTVGLRELQNQAHLEKLIKHISKARKKQRYQPPILVKLSPNMEDSSLNSALDIIQNSDIDGIIATNTTIARNNLTSLNANQVGGLSGYPLLKESTTTVNKICTILNGEKDVIASGGISSLADVNGKINAGAKLVQVYTGLIYHGPQFVKNIGR